MAAFGLVGADVAALLATPVGNLAGLGWMPAAEWAALEALLSNLAARGERHRCRFRQPERQALLGVLGRLAEPESPRTMFALSYAVDSAFLGLLDGCELHSSVRRAPSSFFGEVNNPPPPLGQMTPMSACRRWMRGLMFVGQVRHLDGFGPVPEIEEVSLPARTRLRLNDACDKDELLIGVVSAPRHDMAALVFESCPPATFAVTSLGRAPPDWGRVFGVLREERVHVAVLPELCLDLEALNAVKTHLSRTAARFPCITIAGLTHRPSTSGHHSNEAVVLDASGGEVMRHEKLEPYRLPDGRLEAIVPRTSKAYRYIDSPVGRLVLNVCRDFRADMPMLLNRVLGATFLAVPAYSKKLDFVREEARMLGARQGAITVSVNALTLGNEDAALVYAPVRGAGACEWLAGTASVQGADGCVQVVALTRGGRSGKVSARRCQPV